jgi:hypothetical protein
MAVIPTVDGHPLLTNTAAFGVSEVIAGAVTNVGSITLSGARVSATAGVVAFTNIEYVTHTMAPSLTPYEFIWEMPRNETITLRKVYGLTDQYTAYFSIVEAASNGAWRACTTNIANILAPATGVTATNFTDAVIEAGHRWGLKVEDGTHPSVINLTIGIEIGY